jgi:hypothetical protein
LGFEILQTLSAEEIVVWVSDEITKDQFEALELPAGWKKNQPRETDATSGVFSRSPDAVADGPLTEAEHFGFRWRHNATIVEIGIVMDDQGLLNASRVAKFHEISYSAGTPLYILVSPLGDQFVRVSRDDGRTSDVPTLPEGWQIIDYVTPETLTFYLPNPTLNIRADNQDSFQGPVDIIDVMELIGTTLYLSSGPLPLRDNLCDTPENMDVLLSSESFGALLASGTFNSQQLEGMIAEPARGPFYMFNLIRFREMAQYRDGRETDLTGREANALYAPAEFLNAIGARPVFSTEVDNQIDGDDEEWETVGVVEYPCPIAFFAMVSNPDFQARAIHKDAGVEKTIVIVTDLEPSPLPADFTPPPSPYPATESDPAFELIHVMDFHALAQYEDGTDEPERSGAEAWDLYESNGREAGVSIGSYPTARLLVQGVFQGDDRSWDEIHINHMPSLEAFDALLADDTRQSGRYHRYAALAHNYSLITYPEINDFPGGPNTIEPFPITEYGVGTVCANDADCVGIGTCLSDGSGMGFCTRVCGAGECGDPYLCCHSCSSSVSSRLPFEESAFLTADISEQLMASPASCTCN